MTDSQAPIGVPCDLADPEGAGASAAPGPAAGSLLGSLSCPVLLMNVPLSLSAQEPNNAWMEGLSAAERELDRNSVLEQFLRLYRHIARTAVVYLLPSVPGLQDQTYVANLAAVLPHLRPDTALVSRFRSQPRVGEARVGAEFLRLLGFRVEQPPAVLGGEAAYFEGEADLKHLRGNLYVGAYGMRTSRNVLTWAAERFEMEIVPFRITDPYLYHLDSCLCRITGETVMACTEVADPASLRQLERHCEIISVSREQAQSGVTSGLLLSGELICDSDIAEMNSGHEWYSAERSKLDLLERVCARFGHTLRMFPMPEIYKSGAALSCLVMPLRAAG